MRRLLLSALVLTGCPTAPVTKGPEPVTTAVPDPPKDHGALLDFALDPVDKEIDHTPESTQLLGKKAIVLVLQSYDGASLAALRTLEPLARAGQPQAQLQLGLLYFHGHGVRESDTQATQWFQLAARQGLAEAQYLLGNMYAYGLAPVAADADPQRLAAQWYFEAARQGHAQAQFSLGILFVTGSGVVQDEQEARRWMARAAAQGHADAATYLKGRTD